MQKTAILILAAGSSTRMNATKQLLPYKNTTLLGFAIETAKKTTTNQVFCVLGSNAEIIEESVKKHQVETIFNPNFKAGLSSSIVAGINHITPMNFDAVLIILADQPKITSAYLNELLKTSVENPTKIIASNYGENNGVPVIFPKNYFKELLLLKGDKGAKNLLKKMHSNLISIKSTNLIDIDTEEEYKNL
ncbi:MULTISPECIES: nucleotidyltransferase family protein [Tenacibaculum]|uniref:nucleotidyltransferase family protein n=1 Tax=Tenacibaculum TaxID=104267 RepID=UPI001F0A72EB|nr:MULTISPECIES: nucleotidyltransferase family protein [Tenacibaculum]MCH3881008.1 nucleotidyltransferase family protein [Tenacibaculum aquimarinum]MCH3884121.1 nucleotidyltransferase family protein [Tenacibaculum aquimarinum]MDO6599392.1 nucleotidyltransferase family protein [Tenacibaculum sp. 1_MG-2023]